MYFLVYLTIVRYLYNMGWEEGAESYFHFEKIKINVHIFLEWRVTEHVCSHKQLQSLLQICEARVHSGLSLPLLEGEGGDLLKKV